MTHPPENPLDRIVLDGMRVSIRLVSCDGVSVTFEVNAPPSVPVLAAEDVFSQACKKESENATRPSTLGWSK